MAQVEIWKHEKKKKRIGMKFLNNNGAHFLLVYGVFSYKVYLGFVCIQFTKTNQYSCSFDICVRWILGIKFGIKKNVEYIDSIQTDSWVSIEKYGNWNKI